MYKILTKSTYIIFIVLVLLGISEGIIILFNIPAYMLPKPSAVLLIGIKKYAYFLEATYITMSEAFIGFIIGNVLAYIIAIILILYPNGERTGVAIAVFIKAIPMVAFAPLFIIWFGNDMTGKYIMSALICFFPMLVNSVDGLKAVNLDLLEYLHTLGANKFKILTILRIPSSIPFMISAAKISSTISIVGAIVAELSGADKGIGYILLTSIYQLDTDIMFAAIFYIATAGIIFYYLIEYLGLLLKTKGKYLSKPI